MTTAALVGHTIRTSNFQSRLKFHLSHESLGISENGGPGKRQWECEWELDTAGERGRARYWPRPGSNGSREASSSVWASLPRCSSLCKYVCIITVLSILSFFIWVFLRDLEFRQVFMVFDSLLCYNNSVVVVFLMLVLGDLFIGCTTVIFLWSASSSTLTVFFF